MNNNTQKRTTPVRRFLAAFEHTMFLKKQYESSLKVDVQVLTFDSLNEGVERVTTRGQAYDRQTFRNAPYMYQAIRPSDSLACLLKEADEDFSEGRGIKLTLDELRALTNEVA